MNRSLTRISCAKFVRSIRYLYTSARPTRCTATVHFGRNLDWYICNNGCQASLKPLQPWNKTVHRHLHLKTQLCEPRSLLGRGFNQPPSCLLHTTPVMNWYGHLTVSPEQVNSILFRNELAVEVDSSKGTSVKTFMTNQMGSNNPMEDRRAEAECILTKGMLFGVFDGHHGPACAQVVSERLLNYIAAEVLPYNVLQQALRVFNTGELQDLVKRYLHPNDYVSRDRKLLFRHSLGQYMKDNLEVDDRPQESGVAEMLITSFDRLDKDLTLEALNTSNGDFNDEGLHTVFSGACACVAYVEAKDLYVANAGDCRAVVGRQSDDVHWSAIAVSNDHNTHNIDEVRRIRSTHPQDESSSVIKNGRLLGELAPLRAFGDVRYKWSHSLQHQVLNSWFGANVIPKNYHTPPYLIATPEVIHHHLTLDDRFLILASDGLWDFLTPEKAVNLVGDFLLMRDKVGHFHPPSASMSLEQIHQMLSRRKVALWPRDDNAATHLIRYALGGVHNRFDHHRLANTLSLPDNVVRQYRDDITVTVVFFN